MLIGKLEFIGKFENIIKYKTYLSNIGTITIDSLISDADGEYAVIKMAATIEPGFHPTRWLIEDTETTLVEKIKKAKNRLIYKESSLRVLGVYEQFVDRKRKLEDKLNVLRKLKDGGV